MCIRDRFYIEWDNIAQDWVEQPGFQATLGDGSRAIAFDEINDQLLVADFPAFTGSDIHSIDTDHNNETLAISDQGNISSIALATLSATPERPVLQTNTGIVVVQGLSQSILSTELAFTDMDNADTVLVYTVTQPGAHGTLVFNDGAVASNLTLGASFTQADIDNGYITYHHDESGTLHDRFEFELSDGLYLIQGQLFEITVAANANPPVQSDGVIRLNEGAQAIALDNGNTNLLTGATDADAGDVVSYDSIDTFPSNGTLNINPCLLYTSPSPRDATLSRMPSSA